MSPLGHFGAHTNFGLIYKISKDIATARINKKLSYRLGTARHESLPKIAEINVEMG